VAGERLEDSRRRDHLQAFDVGGKHNLALRVCLKGREVEVPRAGSSEKKGEQGLHSLLTFNKFKKKRQGRNSRGSSVRPSCAEARFREG